MHSTSVDLLVHAVNHDPLVNRLVRLLLGLSFGAPKHQLRNQTPVSRYVPLLGNRRINHRVIMLQVGSEPERLKTNPDYHYISTRHRVRVSL